MSLTMVQQIVLEELIMHHILIIMMIINQINQMILNIK